MSVGVWCVFICVHGHAMAVSGQLAGGGSLLPPCGS